jgi:hypothetical protein
MLVLVEEDSYDSDASERMHALMDDGHVEWPWVAHLLARVVVDELPDDVDRIVAALAHHFGPLS